MAGKVDPVPAGFHTAGPYLIIRGAAEGIAFYQRAFGATELPGRLTGPDGKILNGQMRIGDSIVMVADENPEWGNRGPLLLGGTPVIIVLRVPDVDAVTERAVAAGARVLQPVADQFHGDRSGRLEDPFGHVWIVSTRIEDVPPEEIARRAAAMFGGS
jgi:PhnB protein